MILVTDISGACNLTCPSCPRGRRMAGGATGFMKFPFWLNIVEKARREFRIDVLDFNNWGEPTLNPELDQMVDYCVKHKIPCRVSTNLQRINGLESMIDAGVLNDAFTPLIWVSCSGWSQETYGQTHEGDINQLKSNMMWLSATKDQRDSKTRLVLRWHRYKHNGHEERSARAFARTFGFEFEAQIAWYLPIQDLLAGVKSDPIADLLLVPIDRGMQMAKSLKTRTCPEMGTLQVDANGQTKLCCLTFNKNVGHFATTSFPDLQRQRAQHIFCNDCLSANVLEYLYKTHPKFMLEAARNSIVWDVKWRLYWGALAFGLARFARQFMPFSYKQISDIGLWLRRLT